MGFNGKFWRQVSLLLVTFCLSVFVIFIYIGSPTAENMKGLKWYKSEQSQSVNRSFRHVFNTTAEYTANRTSAQDKVSAQIQIVNDSFKSGLEDNVSVVSNTLKKVIVAGKDMGSFDISWQNQTVNGSFTNIGKTNASMAGNKTKKTLRVENTMGNTTKASLRTPDCKLRQVTLSPKPLPVTGLVSFPGSGNTWTRHLIQQMTGLATSSVYCDKDLESDGFPFECLSDQQYAVIVKTHDSNHLPKFKKVVLLVRNPFDAFLSYANFAKAGHTKHPSEEELKKAAATMFPESLWKYIDLTNKTIQNFTGPVHVLQYEKLKTDMASELAKLCKVLNISVTQRDIECTVELQEGNFHRKHDEANHLRLLRETYGPNELEKMKAAARYTEKMLKSAYNINIRLGGEIENILMSNQ